MGFWETHLHPMLMCRASWEVAVTGQPGKTTHATGLICDFTELFCSRWFIFQVFLYLLAASFLISVPVPEHLTPDGNLT